jgi:hypothetical protein
MIQKVIPMKPSGGKKLPPISQTHEYDKPNVV